MNRRNILTGFGIAASLAIAVGGWAATSALIDMESDKLLSSVGVTMVDAPVARHAAAPNQIAGGHSPSLAGGAPEQATVGSEGNLPIPIPEDGVPASAELELVSILTNWESPGNEVPHEPTAGQIGMEEAIAIGEATLEYFIGRNYHVLSEILAFDKAKTTAYLCQNLPSDLDELPYVPIYSYWVVSFSGEGMGGGGCAMKINAVSGKVWGVDLQMGQYWRSGINMVATLDSAEEMLSDLTARAGFDGSEETISDFDASASPPTMTSYKRVSGAAFAAPRISDPSRPGVSGNVVFNGAYAVIRIRGRLFSDELNALTDIISIQFYLATQPP